MKIIALQETRLTKDLVDSSQVSDPARMFQINEGSEWQIRAIAPQKKNEKVMVTFEKGLGSGNFNTWFLWPAHWKIEGLPRTDYEESKTPAGTSEASKPVSKIEKPGALKLPINWHNSNAYISKYFQVWECTRGDTRRIPAPGSVEESNILKIAAELDKIREEWGEALVVTSWYRPSQVNRECGGAIYSQHITGGAADIYTSDGRDYEFEDFLDRHWGGGLGYGVASGRGFTHLDLREGGWRRGPGTIRWTY